MSETILKEVDALAAERDALLQAVQSAVDTQMDAFDSTFGAVLAPTAKGRMRAEHEAGVRQQIDQQLRAKSSDLVQKHRGVATGLASVVDVLMKPPREQNPSVDPRASLRRSRDFKGGATPTSRGRTRRRPTRSIPR